MMTWRMHGIVCLGLLLVTVASLGQVVTFGFVSLDDPGYVVDNDHIPQGLTPATVRWALTTFDGCYWQPVTWLSLLADSTLFGYGSEDRTADPLFVGAWGFHLTNLVLHGLDVLLVYAVLVVMTGAAGRAAVVAGLFAVHPLHVESVAWVTERKDVLSMLFFLLALLAYQRFALRGGWTSYVFVFVAAFLAMAAKPMTVTLPCVLLLLDYWPLRRFPALTRSRALLEKLPLFALSLGFSLITLHTQSVARMPLDLEKRLAGALAGYAWYLQKTFWPSDLCALYLYKERSFSSPATVFYLGILTGLSVWAWRRRKEQPYLLVGWLWFVGTLLPVSGLFQSGPQSYADRFSYLPHVGLFVAVVWGAAVWLTARGVGGMRQALLGCGTIVVLAILTWRQTGYWYDTPTLFHRIDAVTKDNHRAHAILATYYLDRGAHDEAIYWSKRALATVPREGRYHFVLAVAYARANQIESALLHMHETLRHERERPGYDLEAATICALLGEHDRAIGHYRKHLQAQPTARVFFFLARTLIAAGRHDEARDALHRSLALDPSPPDVQGELEKLGR